jgi:stage II sporulation protein D
VKPDSATEEADPSQAVKLRALVAAALLVAVLLLILQATPPFPASQPPAASAPLFDHEPEIRVRIATLEPGQDVLVLGLAGRGAAGVRIANRAGTPLVGGEPCQPPCVLAPQRAGEIGLGDRRYHGELLVVRESQTSKIHVVNKLPIELYLEGVVLSEMPPDYPLEALFAQAVASRSYAAWQMLARKEKDFDVTDTQRSQVYRGSPTQLALARKVVTATKGQVLMWDGKVLEAVFSSTCGGNTRSAEEAFGDEAPPPLGGARCGLCDGTQFSTWSARAKRADMGRALGLGGPVVDITDASFHKSGRLAQIVAKGSTASKKVTANQFRDLFGSAGRSTWFTRIEVSGDWIVVDGRGFGHGAGMCQVGASRLAGAGRGFQAILSRYYPESTLGWLYPVHES